MPDWLIERGIGETRAALIDHDAIVEARIILDGEVHAGSTIEARLIAADVRNAIATDAKGREYLLPKGARKVTQGTEIRIEVTREAIPGGESWKRPLARIADGALGEAPRLHGIEVSFPSPHDELAAAGWDDLTEQARSGVIHFAGGELRISPTPAMTLIDVDGYLPPDELAVRGAEEAAKAIRRLDIGGSIGIDLPTSGSKAARQRAATAIDHILPQPFERTAVNGFGFVQIVRPRERASLVELAQDRPGFEARALLRRAAFDGPGGKRLVGHSRLIAALEARPEWIAQLSRQAGGAIELRSDPTLPMSGAYAERL